MKKIITDPFLGEIEITKLSSDTLSAVGENRVDTVYTDKRGNCWIETYTTWGDAIKPTPIMYIRKELLHKIIKVFKDK